MRNHQIVWIAAMSWAAGLGCSHAENTRHAQDSISRSEQNIQDIRRDEHRDLAKVNADTNQEKSKIEQRADDKVRDEQRKIADARGDVGVGGSGAVAGNAEPVRTQEPPAMNDPARGDVRPENRALKQGALLTGTLASCSSGSLTMRDFNGSEVKLKTDDNTRVLHHGQAVRLKDFKEGTELKADYVMNGKDRIARQVWVLGDSVKK